MLLSRLLATPDFLARTYTASINAVHMQKAVVEAVKIHAHRYGYRLISKECLDEITEINKGVTSLREKRNKIAHYCWSRETDEVMFGTSFPSGIPSKNGSGYATLTDAELSKLNSKAHVLVERLLTVLSELPEISEESLFPPRSDTGLD